MDRIAVEILNPWDVQNAEKNLVAMARLTQRGEKIRNTEDIQKLLNKAYGEELVESLTALPHPTLQKFNVINIAIVGASRRFLAQITRHQNEVKFMSGSLQYSDYSDAAQFVVPYEILSDKAIAIHEAYLNSCQEALKTYQKICSHVGRDAAGFVMPQGLRNVLIISATPFQWKHMISQRICRRNSLETQYVMLLCWERLWQEGTLFKVGIGPSCMFKGCNERKMSCGRALLDPDTLEYLEDTCPISIPSALLDMNFPIIRRRKKHD